MSHFDASRSQMSFKLAELHISRQEVMKCIHCLVFTSNVSVKVNRWELTKLLKIIMFIDY